MNQTVRKILRAVLIVAAVILAADVGIGLFLTHTEKAEIVHEGVLHLPTATKNTEFLAKQAVSLLEAQYGGSQGQCCAAVKTLSSGETIVGRNFDLEQSKYPIYIGSTNIEGFYPTVYVSNLTDIGPTYASCTENGVPRYIRDIAPFVASDSLNSEGLYIETDMRTNQKDDAGNFEFSCTGTNKDSSVRIGACEVPSYVTMRCKNIDEAVALIEKLDIYTTFNEEGWTLCFILADAEGNRGLLELACNEASWLPGQSIQTNFYVTERFNAIQKYKQGIGRYEKLEKNLGAVESEADMLKLMEGVKYSEIYNLNDPSYDIRSEFAGDSEYLTNEYLENDANWAAYLKEFEPEAKQYKTLSKDEKEAANYYWISLWTTIANCSKKTLSLSFFEEYDISYVLKFD